MAISQVCPICGTAVIPMSRYPNYVCGDCIGAAVDEHGRLVSFANEDISGGLIGLVRDENSGKFVESKELTADPVFFIRGTSCYAAEAHFGGVVVRPSRIEG
jgi:hypothetical protein